MNAFGKLLKEWRKTRKRSQLDLALDAGISARHLSFLETGRSSPSRETALVLAQVLDLPLSARNTLLAGAGFSPHSPESTLSDGRLSDACHAFRLILKQHEPFAAVVIDRCFNVVMANPPYRLFIHLTLGEQFSQFEPLQLLPQKEFNLMRWMFDPKKLRPFIANFSESGRACLLRLQREYLLHRDEAVKSLIQELSSHPDIPKTWHAADLELPQFPVLPFQVTLGGQVLNFWSTLTSLNDPLDPLLEELRVEAFYPADRVTEEAVRQIFEQANLQK